MYKQINLNTLTENKEKLSQLNLIHVVPTNKVKESYMIDWIFGDKTNVNYKDLNTYIQNLMGGYWGHNGDKVITELRILNNIYGMELDLSKETWQPIRDYMEYFAECDKDFEKITSLWHEHFNHIKHYQYN